MPPREAISVLHLRTPPSRCWSGTSSVPRKLQGGLPKLWQWYVRSLPPQCLLTLSTDFCSRSDFCVHLFSLAHVASRVRPTMLAAVTKQPILIETGKERGRSRAQWLCPCCSLQPVWPINCGPLLPDSTVREEFCGSQSSTPAVGTLCGC